MSAAGYLGNFRYNNSKNFICYNNMINENKLPIDNIEVIGNKEKEIEYIIFKLRETSGINLKDFKDKFGVSFMDKYENEINQFIDQDYFIIDESFRFSKKGMNLSNQFLSLII